MNELSALVQEHIMGGEPGEYARLMGDAWRVVLKLREAGAEINLMADSRPAGDQLVRGYTAEFHTEDNTGYGSAFHDFAPHAICEAALKLFGVQWP